jgi:hypothetical protein
VIEQGFEETGTEPGMGLFDATVGKRLRRPMSRKARIVDAGGLGSA